MPIPPIALALLWRVALGVIVTVLLLRFRGKPQWHRAVIMVWLALLVGWLDASFSAQIAAWFPQPTAVTRVLTAVNVLLVAYAGLQILDVVVWERALARQGRPLPRLLVDLFNFGVLVLVILALLNQVFEVDLTALLVTSTVVSAVIGLAMQDTLRNLIAGVTLHVDQPFTIGEWVTVAGFEGEVIQINWRTLTIRTRENNTVVLTNSKVSNEDIINYARPTHVSAVDMLVGIAYGNPPAEVKAALYAAAREAEGVVSTPEPLVYVEDYGDSAMTYRVRVWIDDWARRPLIRDAVMRRIWYRLRRAGVSTAFPVRDVSLRTVSPDADTAARASEQAVIHAVLRPLPLLASLRDDHIDALAAESVLERFTQGEFLCHQGEPGDSLFVLRSGRVRVDVDDGDGHSVPVAERGPGDFLGEMSLLTGEPRSATVQAEAETEVVVVAKSAVAALLLEEPDIANGLSEALAERVLERDTHLAEAEAAAHASPAKLKADLLHRMRSFFGL
jgi:small-conductance mechanosensitive channel/CRP-like cAMP-binding protein